MSDIKNLLLALRPAVKEVKIDGIPEAVFLSQLSGKSFIELQARKEKNEDPTEFAISAIQLCLVQKSGEQVFSESELHQIRALPYSLITKLFTEILKLNSFSDQALDEAKKLKTDYFRRFLFSLAAHLHKTVQEIEQISVSELVEWSAYFALEHENQLKSDLEREAIAGLVKVK